MQKIFTFLLVLISCISNPTNSFSQITTQDSLTLVDLYNRTDGAVWTDNSGWLSGPISDWYGITTNGTNVTSIALGNNNLTDTIPDSIGGLSALDALNLGGNNLTGTIPTSIGNLSNLTYLDLNSNQLTGSIPYSLGNLTLLTTLYLYNNELSGSIPGTLGNLSSLSDLELYSNNLSGSIPDSLQTLSPLLTYLDLSSNQLTGNVPTFFGSFFNMYFLNLSNNQLSGSIPSALGTNDGLTTLNLSYNQLTGTIPSSLGNYITGLSLSHNQLSGTMPSSLGNSKLFFLDLSYNQLSGTVPSSFTNLTSATSAINNNEFTFDGLEAVAQAIPGGQFVDSPQAIIPLHLNSSVLSTYAGGTLANDTFYWYDNGVLDTTIVGDSTFPPIPFGNYSVIVSNEVVTPVSGLRLYSDTIAAGLILPVTYLNFTGTLVNDNALLLWQTGAEINTSYFNIQRSTDDISFEDIGRVNAAGNNTGTENYQYTDDVAAFIGQQQNLFYRLQEVDKNGNATLSKIINIPLNGTSSITIYPNPVADMLNISLGNNTGNILIDIVDANGTKEFEQEQMIQPGSHMSINTSNLATGIYFIQLNINGTVSQQKFIKQ